jgi:PAS domain S-box-containing protein
MSARKSTRSVTNLLSSLLFWRRAPEREGIEGLIRTFWDSAPAGMALATLSGEWIEFNPAVARLTGHSREALLATSLRQLTHADDRRREAAQVSDLLAGRIDGYTLDKRVTHADGRYGHIQLTARLIRKLNGEPDCFAWMIEPPGPQQSSRDLLKAFFDRLEEVAVIRSDRAGVITGWNLGAETLLGYVADEAVGQQRSILYDRSDVSQGKPAGDLRVARDGIHAERTRRVKKSGQSLVAEVLIGSEGGGESYIEIIRPSSVSQSLAHDSAERVRKQSQLVIDQLRSEITSLKAKIDERATRDTSMRESLVRLKKSFDEKTREFQAMGGALRREIDRRKAVESDLATIRAELARRSEEWTAEIERLRTEAAAAQRAIEEREIVDEIAPRPLWHDLSEASLPELLLRIAAEQRTGTLLVRREIHDKQVFIEKGRLFSCASNDPELLVGELFVSKGYITEEQREEALEMQQRTGLAVGRIVGMLANASEEQMLEIMREKSERELADLFRWPNGTFLFAEDQIPSLEVVPLDGDLEALVRSALARIGEGGSESGESSGETAEKSAAKPDEPSAAPPGEPPGERVTPDEEQAAVEPPEPAARVIGAGAKKSRRRYHRPDCRSLAKASAGSRVEFPSRAEAEAAGYSPCGSCSKE